MSLPTEVSTYYVRTYLVSFLVIDIYTLYIIYIQSIHRARDAYIWPWGLLDLIGNYKQVSLRYRYIDLLRYTLGTYIYLKYLHLKDLDTSIAT